MPWPKDFLKEAIFRQNWIIYFIILRGFCCSFQNCRKTKHVLILSKNEMQNTFLPKYIHECNFCYVSLIHSSFLRFSYNFEHTDLGTPTDSNFNVNYCQLGCPGLYVSLKYRKCSENPGLYCHYLQIHTHYTTK